MINSNLRRIAVFSGRSASDGKLNSIAENRSGVEVKLQQDEDHRRPWSEAQLRFKRRSVLRNNAGTAKARKICSSILAARPTHLLPSLRAGDLRLGDLVREQLLEGFGNFLRRSKFDDLSLRQPMAQQCLKLRGLDKLT